MIKISSILFLIPLVWVLTSCSEPAPLGGIVNKEKSDRYFRGWNKKDVYFKQFYGMKGINYVKYHRLEGADGSSFVVLKENLAMDNQSVFYSTIKQDQLDRPSFYLNQYGVECDKKGVYTLHYDKIKKGNYFKLVDGADPRSFRYLEAEIYNKVARNKFAQDDYSVFKATPYEYEYLKTDMHSPSFRILNQHFATDKDSVYLFLKDGIVAIPVVEGKLEPMGPFLWNNDVIYAVGESARKWRAIPVKDPNSVSLGFDVEGYKSRSKVSVPYLWVDKTLYLWDELYHYGWLDMATLTDYPHAGYYKDKDHVYYREKVNEEDEDRLPGRLLPEADPGTFEELKSNVFRDKNNIYAQGMLLVDVDPDTFTKIEDIYGVFKDKDRVYISVSGRLVVIKDADPSTFEPVNQGGRICRDKNRVYQYNKSTRQLEVVPGADGFTFEKIGIFNVFRDKNRVYYHNTKEMVPKEMADAATFAPLESHVGMYQDKDHLYFYTNESYLAWIKGGMDIESMHSHRANNFVFDKYGIFIGDEDGEREPYPFGEINVETDLKNIRKFAREKQSKK